MIPMLKYRARGVVRRPRLLMLRRPTLRLRAPKPLTSCYSVAGSRLHAAGDDLWFSHFVAARRRMARVSSTMRASVREVPLAKAGRR